MDQLGRLEAMAADEDGLTWDLSDNDRAACAGIVRAVRAAQKLVDDAYGEKWSNHRAIDELKAVLER